MGCGIGGLDVTEAQMELMLSHGPRRVSPFFIPMMIPNMASGQIAILTGAKGPNLTVTTACASSIHAIGEAFRTIQRGDAEIILTGGTEASITPLGLQDFARLGLCHKETMSRRRLPVLLTRRETVFVMGEGAFVLVLETLGACTCKRCFPYAEIVGYGSSDDAHHIVEPHPEGERRSTSHEKRLG